MGKSLLLTYGFLSAFASVAFALSPQDIKNKNSSDLARLEAELRTHSHSVSEAEQAWTRKLPDLVSTFCAAGALRDSVVAYGAKCRSCGEIPGFSALMQSSETCRSLSRAEWNELLTSPRSRGALRFSAEALDAETKAHVESLVDSRYPVRKATALYEGTRRRLDQLRSLQEITSCKGEPISKINLDEQFPPTLDQGNLGTCYAYAATALAEAAIYRNEGRRVSLSPVYAATCSRLPGGVSSNESSLDGGNTEEVLRHWLKRGRSLSCSGETCTVEEVEKNLQAGIAASKEVEKMERDNPKAIVPLSGDDYRLDDLSGDVYSTPGRCDPLDAKNSVHLKKITESLCRGIPVATATYIKDFDKSSDGGKTWTRVPEAPGQDLWHAMVITGIEWANGEPHYVFRNSEGQGDASTPYASKMRLPVSAGCRIYQASTLSGTRDGPARSPGPVIDESTSAH